MTTYPAVGRLIHVPLHFLGVGHQVLHAAVLQGCRVRGWKDGLDAARTTCSVNRLSRHHQYLGILYMTTWRERNETIYLWGRNILLREMPTLSQYVNTQMKSLSGDNNDLSIYLYVKHTNFCYVQ